MIKIIHQKLRQSMYGSGSDNSFKDDTFKAESGWTGSEQANGQMIVFSASKALNPGESVKFGLITDKKASGINWKSYR